MLGDVSGRVGFYEQVKVPGLMVARDRGVGADDLFEGTVGLREGGSNGDVLTDWEAEDGGWGRELEPVALAEVSKLSLGDR